jgi:hypothetical protein
MGSTLEQMFDFTIGASLLRIYLFLYIFFVLSKHLINFFMTLEQQELRKQ